MEGKQRLSMQIHLTHAYINNLRLYKIWLRLLEMNKRELPNHILNATFRSEHIGALVCTVTHASKQKCHSVYITSHTHCGYVWV